MTDEPDEADGEAQSLNTYTPGITRRRMLQGTAAAGAVGMLSGVGSAQETSSEGYVVGLEAGASSSVATGRAGSVRHTYDFGNIGKAVSGQYSKQDLETLRQLDDVRYVEPIRLGEPNAETLPFGVDRVDAEKVHTNGKTGKGADIVIVDSGIDLQHPDLKANIGESKSFVEYTDSPDDQFGHGTFCAGVADAINDDKGVVGVSTEATLHAAKTVNQQGLYPSDDVAQGIRWAAEKNYDVASISLLFTQDLSILRDACAYAYNTGVLLVACAGNAGQPNTVRWPAKYESVIAVSATNRQDELADFSSSGPTVELTGPGVEVKSTTPGGYDKGSGTSFSCPLVSGAGGILMANGFTNKEARQRMRDTAEDIGLPPEKQGYGLLDVEKAVQDQQPTEKTLRVEGTGEYAYYAFTASGDVTITEDDKEDEVDGSTVDGAVGPDSDSYTFTGELERFYLGADAKVFVDGEQIDPSDYPSSLHTIMFNGKGSYATYEFSVSETIADSRGLDQEDSISGNHAEGAVASGQELYVYTGDLTDITTTGDVGIVKADVTAMTGDKVVTTNEEGVQANEV